MGAEEYPAEHVAGQFTGAGILLAGVVGSEQARQAARKLVAPTMSEAE